MEMVERNAKFEGSTPGNSAPQVVARRLLQLDLEFRYLETVPEFDEAAALLWRIWGARGKARKQVMTAPFLQTLAGTGHFVVGAYRQDELVACSVGLLATDPKLPAEDQRVNRLHSDITGVKPLLQNKGFGLALKRYQREWALKRGISTITWTVDPLIHRNAYFNLSKLRATVVDYKPDYYGDLDDGINTGEITDRLLMSWSLTSPQVVAAMEGDIRVTKAEAVRVADEARQRDDAELIHIPDNTQVGQRSGSSRSRRWLRAIMPVLLLRRLGGWGRESAAKDNGLRLAMRERFTTLLGDGYGVVGVSSDGHYVLRSPERSSQRQ